MGTTFQEAPNTIIELAKELLKNVDGIPDIPPKRHFDSAVSEIAQSQVGIDVCLSYDRVMHYTRIRLDGIANCLLDGRNQIYGTRILSIPRPKELTRKDIREKLENAIMDNWDLYILETANFTISEYYHCCDGQMLEQAYRFKKALVGNSYRNEPGSRKQLKGLAEKYGKPMTARHGS